MKFLVDARKYWRRTPPIPMTTRWPGARYWSPSLSLDTAHLPDAFSCLDLQPIELLVNARSTLSPRRSPAAPLPRYGTPPSLLTKPSSLPWHFAHHGQLHLLGETSEHCRSKPSGCTSPEIAGNLAPRWAFLFSSLLTVGSRSKW
jgi:hypothetical protein